MCRMVSGAVGGSALPAGSEDSRARAACTHSPAQEPPSAMQSKPVVPNVQNSDLDCEAPGQGWQDTCAPRRPSLSALPALVGPPRQLSAGGGGSLPGSLRTRQASGSTTQERRVCGRLEFSSPSSQEAPTCPSGGMRAAWVSSLRRLPLPALQKSGLLNLISWCLGIRVT